jgi:hypothetical protein
LRTASQPQVNSFLKELKAIITSGRGLFMIPRASNNATITMLGLTRKTVELEILSLSTVDYSSGPEQDRDRPGDLWIFGKTINGHEIYIKLKIAEIKDTKIAKCISFHKAEFSLTYPFKK